MHVRRILPGGGHLFLFKGKMQRGSSGRFRKIIYALVVNGSKALMTYITYTWLGD